MQGEQADAEQRQGVELLVVHAGLEHLEVFRAQQTAQAMGAEGAEGDAGEAEQGRQHEKDTRHE